MTHVHLIGIGGSGLSAIARLLLERGYVVSGSDQQSSAATEELARMGAHVFVGHRAENIQGADLVVRSSAVADENPEVQAAQAAGIPVLKRSDFLGGLMAENVTVAVAGTHGKSTTTAMIAWMLTALGQEPSYIIGGVAKNLGGNAHAGQGPVFVIEADEYDRMFLGLNPDVAVVTHVEHDHPDCFPTPVDYYQAFGEFVGRLRAGGLLLACADQQGAVGLVEAAPPACTALTYGLKPGSDYRAHITGSRPGLGFSFRAALLLESGAEAPLAEVHLQVPGEHNVRNALAALAVAHRLGLDVNAAAEALGQFSGTGRRFDVLGEAAGVVVVDDYAHHPTEIRTTLAGARSRYAGRRIWAVWQPHTYSRTQLLLDEFAQSFADADRVLVTEIYAAREKPQDFSSAAVVAKMSGVQAQYVRRLDEAAALLLAEAAPGDVILVLSAGDATQVSAQVLASLRTRGGEHA